MDSPTRHSHHDSSDQSWSKSGSSYLAMMLHRGITQSKKSTRPTRSLKGGRALACKGQGPGAEGEGVEREEPGELAPWRQPGLRRLERLTACPGGRPLDAEPQPCNSSWRLQLFPSLPFKSFYATGLQVVVLQATDLP